MKKLIVFLLTLAFTTSILFSAAVSGAGAAKSDSGKTITITGEIVKFNPGVPYKKEVPALKTADATYVLTGSTKNIEKYIGFNAKMTGTTQKGPQGILFFNVKNYKVIKNIKNYTPTSIPTPVPTLKSAPTNVKIGDVSPNYKKLTGYLSILDLEKARFILKTDSGAYELMGETKGLENEGGKKLEVTGNYIYTLVATEFPLFHVISYKVIEEATPTAAPTAIIITEKDNGGYVYVKKGDDVKLVLESNKTTGYSWNFDEKPDASILELTNYEYIVKQDNVDIVGAGGSEVWTFKAVETGTAVMYLSYSRPWESVLPAKNFKVKVIVDQLTTPTPVYDVLRGSLSVSVIKSTTDENLVPQYEFLLKTEKGPFNLLGNVKGLEKCDGKEIEVTGSIGLAAIYPPYFNVVSYKILSTPTVNPSPTPAVSSKTHTVISNKALYLSDPSIGSMMNAMGYTTISWTEGTQKAFFKAKVFLPELNRNADYEFDLVEASACDSSSIKGFFNITMEGKLVAEKIHGTVYGLDAPVGSYFKFYSDDFKWHVSAYVTSRIDF